MLLIINIFEFSDWIWCVFFFQIHFRPFRVYFFSINYWNWIDGIACICYTQIFNTKKGLGTIFSLHFHCYCTSAPRIHLNEIVNIECWWHFSEKWKWTCVFGYMWAFVYRSTVVWTIFVIAFTAFNWKWLHSPRSFRAKKESVIKFVGNGEILSNLINFSPRLWTVCLREHFYISIHYVSINFNFDEEQNK